MQHSAATSGAVNRLETDPIGRLLLSYSLPAIASMTVVSLYNIISSIFIGHGVGPLAIAALAVTFPFINLILAVSMLVAIGGATVCSIELGAKNPDRAHEILGHVVVFSLVFGVLFGLVGLFFLDPVLILFGASADTLGHARDYLEIILWGAPLSFLMLALGHFIRASGYPARSMGMTVLSVGVNLILTPVFIFGFRWGMRGAGIATILAQTVSLAAMLVHFFRADSTVRFRPGIFKVRAAVFRPVLGIGLSPFLMNLCACVIVIIINQRLRVYGGDLAIGAYGIGNRLVMLFVMIIMGLTQGMQPLIGYNFGARRPDRVWRTLVYGLVVATTVTVCGFLAFHLFPEPLVLMFTDYPELVAMSVSGLRLVSLAFFLVGFQIVVTAYFQSLGRALVAIFLSLSRQLLFLLPCLILLPLYFGLDGVWLSLPLADSLAFTVTASMFVRVLKRGPEGSFRR
jgi:putative MATE family efflux protein